MKIILFISVLLSFLISPSDAQQVWTQINLGLSNYGVRGLVADAHRSGVLYGGTTKQGIYISTNGGDNWVLSNSGINRKYEDAFRAITVDPNNSSIIYVGSHDTTGIGGALYKSTDNGIHWNSLGSGLIMNGIGEIVIDEQNSDNVWVGVHYGGGIQRSNNAGIDFLPYTGNGGVQCLTRSPFNQNIFIAGRSVDNIIRSSDAGLNWYKPSVGVVNPGDGTLAVTFDPNNSGVCYAGIGSMLYKSTDDGKTWNLSTDLHNVITSIIVNRMNSSELWVSMRFIGIRKSTDAGNTWTTMHQGLTTLDVSVLLQDPFDSSVFYAGTYGGGIFRFNRGIKPPRVNYYGDSLIYISKCSDVGSTFYIQNIGSSILNVSSITLEGIDAKYFVLDPNTGTWSIDPGNMISFRIIPSKVSYGKYHVKVKIMSNDPQKPLLEKNIDFTLYGPDAKSKPFEIINNFTTAPFDTSITVYNNGTSQLKLISARLEGKDAQSYLIINPTFPSFINPKDSIEIILHYAPIARTSDTAKLIITTDDCLNPELSILLISTNDPTTSSCVGIDTLILAKPNDSIRVPIRLFEPLNRVMVFDYSFTLEYDSAVLLPLNVIASGPIGTNFSPKWRVITPGQLEIGGVGQPGFTGPGRFLEVLFIVFVSDSAETEIRISNFEFNDGLHPKCIKNGHVHVNVSCDVQQRNSKSFSDNIQLIAYPNPSRDIITLRYSLLQASNVIVEVYDILGTKKIISYAGYCHAGWNEFSLNHSSLLPGRYFIRINTRSSSKNVPIVFN